MVRRPATIVAGPPGTAGGCGTISPTKLTPVPTGPTADDSVGKMPIPWEWMSEPPYWVSGLKTPLVTVPYRVSSVVLPATSGRRGVAAHAGDVVVDRPEAAGHRVDRREILPGRR